MVKVLFHTSLLLVLLSISGLANPSRALAADINPPYASNLNGWQINVSDDLALPDEILKSIKTDINLSFSRIEPDSLPALADYLNQLYPELDVNNNSMLSTKQLEKIIGIARQANSVAKQATSDWTDNEIKTLVKYLQTKLQQRYAQLKHCNAYLHIDGIDTVEKRIALVLRVANKLESETDFDESSIACSKSYQASLSSTQADVKEKTIWVNRITLQIDELQSNQISKEQHQSLDKSIEQLLRAKTNYVTEGISGFSEIDLQYVLMWLTSLDDGARNAVQLSEVQNRKLTQALLQLRADRGLSFKALGELSTEVKRLFRQQGFILASSYIPKQNFAKAYGDVKLAVLLGRLSAVEVQSKNKMHYHESVIKKPFEEHIGKVVTGDISKNYYFLNDMPGLSLQSGLFEPGDNQGETKLVLNVEEKRWSAMASADNYGTDFTGKYRAIVSANWFNPIGRGDSLNVGLLHAFDPDNSSLGSLSYDFPLTMRLGSSFSYDRSAYDASRIINGLSTVFEGETDTYNLGLEWKLKRSQQINMDVGLNVFHKRTETDVIFSLGSFSLPRGQEEKTKGAGIYFDMNGLNNRFRTAFNLNAAFTHGENDNSISTNIDDDFDKLSLSMDSASFLKGEHIPTSRLVTQIEARFSDQSLPSYEQFSLGGPYTVRAYSASTFLVDKGVFAKLAWQINLFDFLEMDESSQSALDLGVFYEVAHGKINEGGIDATLSGYGLSARYRWGRRLSLDSSFSFRGKFDTNDGRFVINDSRDSKFLINLRYEFNP